MARLTKKYVVGRGVPPAAFEQWKCTCEALLATLREAQLRANLSPEEADIIAAEAVQASRAMETDLP